MRIRERYRRLTLWNKLGVWGALASLLGVVLTLGMPLLSETPRPVHSSLSPALETPATLASPPAQPKPPGAKAEHRPSPKPPAAGVEINAPVAGPVVISQGQTGGQVAATINNYGPPQRAIGHETREAMVRILKSVAPACAGFASTQGDPEAHAFRLLLIDVFRDAGWDARDMETFMFFGSHKGVVITIPFGAAEAGIPQLVAQAIQQTGSPISGNRGDMARDCGVYVQVWHAP